MKTMNNVHIGEIVFVVTAEHEESELAAYISGKKTEYTIMPAEICDITKEGNIIVNPYHITFLPKEDVCEFGIPSLEDGLFGISQVLCFSEKDAKKHILKQKLIEEFKNRSYEDKDVCLEQLLLMKAGFTVKRNPKDMERELSEDVHPVNFASFITVAGGSSKVVVYHGDAENMEILWQGIVDDIPFPKVPYGDWIVEHHTVVNDEDILKVFLKEPEDHFGRKWSDIKITNIKWDTSEDTKVWAKLPDEVCVLEMDIDLSKYDPSEDLDYNDDFLDDVSEWLTSHYDFCHDGFEISTK